MRNAGFIVATVFLCSLPCLAQNELPPTWSSSQGGPNDLSKPAKKTAAANAAMAGTSSPPVMSSAASAAPSAPALPLPAAALQPPASARASSPAYAPRTQQTAPPAQFIDISTPLNPSTTPVYEGNPPLQITFTADQNRGDALDLSLLSMGSHTGTHIDAPLHFLKNGATIDQVPLPQLVGPARVLDIDPRVTAITAAELNKYNWQGAARILFRTRNSDNNWMVDPVFHRDFVYLAPDAAEMLANAGVELVGIDYLSIEQFGAPPQAHIALLKRGCVIAEGLDLKNVSAGDYLLTILPLKIMGHEAAPARAMLQPLR